MKIRIYRNIVMFTCVFLLSVYSGGRAFADVVISNYTLGISPKAFHDKLVSDKFVFKKFTRSQIHAVKKIAANVTAGSEFPDATESTEIKARICSGKIFIITMTSVYNGNQRKLLLGRKSFYQYLRDNNAVYESINLHKNEDNPQAVLNFTIDRNNQTNKNIKGIESAKVAIGMSRRLTKNNVPLLEMRYSLENKWFCPN